MAITVGDGVFKFRGDTSDFDSSMKKSAESFEDYSKRMEKGFDALRKAGTAVVGAVAAISGVSIKMAIDAVESESLFTTAMGKMADSATRWSKSLSEALGLNEYELRKQIGTIYTMTQSMGFSEEAAFDLSKGMVELAYDMASFYNLSPEEAFDKLRSGLVGQARPLMDLGILTQEATVEAYALKEGMIQEGQAMTDVQKVQARWLAITKQTTAAQGDMAKTLDSPANQIRILKTQFEETATKLGMALLPAFQKLVGLAKTVADAISGLVDKNANLVAVLLGLVGGGGALLLFLGLTPKIASAIKSVKLGYDILVTAIRAATAAQWLHNAAQLANPIGLAAVAIGGAVFAIHKLAEATGNARQEWIDFTSDVRNNAQDLAADVDSAFDQWKLSQAEAYTAMEEENKSLYETEKLNHEQSIAANNAYWGQLKDMAENAGKSQMQIAKDLYEERKEAAITSYNDQVSELQATFDKEITELERVAQADMDAIQSRLDFYRDKAYERMRIIDEVTLKELAAVDPQIAAIVEVTNAELQAIDERAEARRRAEEEARLASLKEQLAQEGLTEAEKERILRQIEAIEDGWEEQRLINERNRAIEQANMETYLGEQLAEIQTKLAEETEAKKTALDQQLLDLEENHEQYLETLNSTYLKALEYMENQRLEEERILTQNLADYKDTLDARLPALQEEIDEETAAWQAMIDDLKAMMDDTVIYSEQKMIEFAILRNDILAGLGAAEEALMDIPEQPPPLPFENMEPRSPLFGGALIGGLGSLVGTYQTPTLEGAVGGGYSSYGFPEPTGEPTAFNTANIRIQLDSQTIAEAVGVQITKDILMTEGMG